MKEQWQRLALRIDALSLRERAMAFAIVALVLITLVDTFVLDPLLSAQKQRAQQIKLDQQQIAAMQAEIKAIVGAHSLDPDAANKVRLQALRRQSEKLRADLAHVGQSIVAPEKMASLLEDLLKKNRNLRLVSLKTLPVTQLSELEPVPGKAPGGTPPAAGASPGRNDQNKAEGRVPSDLVYKHGVELVVQGGYAEIVNYLSQLEHLPWRLFWAKAKLNAEEHPRVSLTLTLYTISLDKTWLNI